MLTLRASNDGGPVKAAVLWVLEMAYVNGQENALAGGLRIKTTSTKEALNSPGITTAYAYDNNQQSTATLYSRPRYVQLIRNELVAKYYKARSINDNDPNPSTLGCISPDYAPQLYLISPAGIVPMSTTQGYHLGYDQVTVTQASNGRSEYYYYGAPLGKRYEDVCYRNIETSQCDPKAPVFPAVPLLYAFSRGQLKFERAFSEAGKMLKEIQYTYQYDSSKTVTPAYIGKYVGTGAASFYNTYERKSYWKTQTETTETKFSAEGTTSNRTKKTYRYDSPYHRQLTQQLTTHADNNVLAEKHQYVADFRPAAVAAIADGTAAYQAACTTCDAAYRASGCGAHLGCLFHAYLDNVVCRANARKDYIAYRRANFTDPVNNYQTTHNTAKNNADGVLKPLLQLQDDYHNALVETSQWRNNQLLGASYTVFGPGLSQPATMYPAKQFALALAAPSATFTPASISGTGLSTDPRYGARPEMTMQFDQGNLVEMQPKTGPVISYLWGYTNTLPIAQAKGLDYATLSAAYRSAGDNLTNLRGAPTLAKAQVTTYAHQPLVGLTSQTDLAGRTTTYEYDALGRLVRTRDDKRRILSQQEYHYAGQ